MKKTILSAILVLLTSSLFALPFNSLLTSIDLKSLEYGKTLIRNIDYVTNICLDENYDSHTKEIVDDIKDLKPKYLAEIISIRKYEGNENLNEKLNMLLMKIPDYAGIPYWSERAQAYFDLYTSAEIVDVSRLGKTTTIEADLVMDPFGLVKEDIIITKDNDSLSYSAYNTNTLKYSGISVASPKKLRVRIYLFRYEDKWILYGIGGVNAPHIPFMTDRIRTSFINRINTFCNYIFEQL